MTDTSLLVSEAAVSRAAEGDRAAQQEVLLGVYAFVRRTLYRLLLGRVQELDDLQQTSLLKVLVGLKSYRGEASFKTWVTGICVNVVRDHLRGAQRTPVLQASEDGLAAGTAPGAHGQEQRIQARETLDFCARALEKMPINQRTVFILRNVYGHSVDEIASIMGSARSTTRLRLYYARKAFRRELECYDSWSADLLPNNAGSR